MSTSAKQVSERRMIPNFYTDGDSPGLMSSMRSTCISLAKYWWMLALSVLVALCFAVIYTLSVTPEYGATASLYVTSSSGDNSQAAYQGSLASQMRVSSYSELADSDAVLARAIQLSGLDISVDDARESVSSRASVDTALFEVTAQATDPVSAVKLVDGVSRSITEYVSALETPAGGGVPLAKVTVVSPAAASNGAISPRVKETVLVAAFVGLFLGVAIALGYSRLVRRVSGYTELSAEVGLPLLSSIPTNANGSVLERWTVAGRESSSVVEAYRRLRLALRYSEFPGDSRSLLITSASADDGKSTTSANLSVCLAQEGFKVLLIDCDLRRGKLPGAFGVSAAFGVIDLVQGLADRSDVLQHTSIDGLDILAGGECPPDPLAALSSQKFSECLREFSIEYDWVIVDSPPLGSVADSLALAPLCDGVLLVVRDGRTRYADVRSSARDIFAVGANLLGVLLNDSKLRAGYYGYDVYNSTSVRDSGAG
ncbi:polysaccharide biosynthesis tyrosine autokinase [Gordonia sp. NPDC003504]